MGLEVEIGSIGVQHGSAGTEYWARGIDTVAPMRDVGAQGRGQDRQDCMQQFRAAWERFSADPARLPSFRSIAQCAPIPPQRWSGIIAAPSSIEGFSMTDDTVVFDAMRFNIRIGQYVWTRRVGTPEAIQRDGLFIAGLPQYCPREWLNEKGYVDAELARKHPYPPTKSAGA